MALSVETANRLLASGRNYASTIVGFIGGIGLMSASQSKGLSDAFAEMFNGLSMIVHGATSAWAILVVAFPVIGAVMAKLASNSATVDNQAVQVKAAVKDPNTQVSKEASANILEATTSLDVVKKDETKITVTDPEIAQKVPSAAVQPAN
jgi:short subunit fatty acids transporter